jgi:hypothetical protein
MARVFGVLSILLGAVIVGFNPNRWDSVLFDLPRGHGVHVHDVIGMALIVLGIVLMWRAGGDESPAEE